MPTLPKFIGDLYESAFSSTICKVTVVSTSMLSDHVKLIRFRGDFPKVKFKLGQSIYIRVDDTHYRNYSPSLWDSELGIFEVIFHIHGNGPGSMFVNGLLPEQELSVSLPRGFNTYRKDVKYQFFFGDETCISIFKSFKDAINRDDNNYLGILELDQLSAQVPQKIGLMVDSVPKSIDSAAFAIANLNRLTPCVWELWQHGVFYLMGNAKSIQAFRKALKLKGVLAKNIYTQPFWAPGKTGL